MRRGAYYRRNDARALAHVLSELMAMPERRAELSSSAAHAARERFSWDAVTDADEALFLRLTRTRR